MTSPTEHALLEEWPPPIGELVVQAKQAMTDAMYAHTTIRRYMVCWQRGVNFARHTGRLGPLSNAFVEDWLAEEGYAVGTWPVPRPVALSILLTAMRVLVQVHEFGMIVPGRILDPLYRFAHIGRYTGGEREITGFGQSAGEQRVAALPPPFRQVFLAYQEDGRQRGCRPTTLKNAQLYIPRLLNYLLEQGVTDFSDITPAHISTFLTSLQGYAPRTVAHYSCQARCLLRFLHQRGHLDEDLSASVPPAPIRNYARIPTVWTCDEVERLLAQVDRGSPQGKRDYTILLLAARVGMRVGDIIRLTLDELNWEQKRIELLQSKTGQPLVVPLLDDLGWAFIDYLKHARPVSAYRQVFLRLTPPYAPFVSHDNLHHIITRYRRMAGIQRFQHQSVGLHTLRHSLATQLLTDNTPLSTIAEVLGHASRTSTEVYAKVDLRHLQQCPLDPEEVGHASS
ncbi:MAG: tyrosine-type recombinase/integrase [Kiritimatiellia bacterium]